jgi:hypothetical protein
MTMNEPTKIIGTCRRVVLRGVPLEPEWSELRGKLTFLKYAKATGEQTQEEKYVVYAHAQEPLREVAWMKLFPGVEVVWKVSEFEECEHYSRFQAAGQLRTLGVPLRKDMVRGGEARKPENLKRKRGDKCQSMDQEKHQLESAAEEALRAAQLETAEAQVVVKEAELALQEAKATMYKAAWCPDLLNGESVSSTEMNALENTLNIARGAAAVAQARDGLLVARLEVVRQRARGAGWSKS